ncbi:hypothetical protein H0H81_000375 [Sphagnurus paluster]|uniref:Uncharacterized protein n=1 Tax=Sphagnurus paluster TaxID=117069 RepID=A0A9P7FU32_9AGAR|nr:hypothetical protein H0H81_000375 [Sphagnurus paluster]
MRFILASAVALSSLFSSVAGFNNLGKRDAFTTDVCAEVNAVLQVSTQPGKVTTIGRIQACLCISTLPSFIITNILAIQASALVGKPKTTDLITDMFQLVSLETRAGSPARTDTYQRLFSALQPAPARGRSQSVTENAVSSLDVPAAMPGVTSTGEAISNALAARLHAVSSGAVPNPGNASIPRPTSKAVHRCMPGYKVNSVGDSCVYVEEEDPALLAAQYGLEHVPLQ